MDELRYQMQERDMLNKNKILEMERKFEKERQGFRETQHEIIMDQASLIYTGEG